MKTGWIRASLPLLFLSQVFATGFTRAEESPTTGAPQSPLPGPTPPACLKQKPAETAILEGRLRLEEAKAEFDKLFPDQKPSATQSVDGFTVKGAPELLEIFAQAMDVGSGLLAGAKSPRSWIRDAKAECGDSPNVICVLKTVLKSEEAAYRLFNLRKRSGVVASISQHIRPKDGTASDSRVWIWRRQELRSIDLAMKLYSSIPQEIQPTRTMSAVYRLGTNRDYPYPNNSPFQHKMFGITTNAYAFSGNFLKKGYVALFNPADRTETFTGRLKTLVHEIAHHIDYTSEAALDQKLSDTAEFQQINWTKSAKTGDPVVSAKNEFISNYAAASPIEDFAESVAYYALYPGRMRADAPKMYEFIKARVFKGREFQEEEFWGGYQLARDQIVPELGGVKAIVDRCLKEVVRVECNPAIRMNPVYLTIASRDAKGVEKTTVGYDAFMGSASCLDVLEARMDKALWDDPEYCMYGGKKGLRERLMRYLEADMRTGLYALPTLGAKLSTCRKTPRDYAGLPPKK